MLVREPIAFQRLSVFKLSMQTTMFDFANHTLLVNTRHSNHKGRDTNPLNYTCSTSSLQQPNTQPSETHAEIDTSENKSMNSSQLACSDDCIVEKWFVSVRRTSWVVFVFGKRILKIRNVSSEILMTVPNRAQAGR